MSTGQLLKPGGGFNGSEAPVRRAMKIALANGLTITPTKRDILSQASDHHNSQRAAFAADMSNGSSPTPQMDKVAREIATALGHPGFRAGVLTVNRGPARAQLLWRTRVGANHFNHVHFGVKMSGSHGGGGGGHPRLTQPAMQGEAITKIQRRLVALGFDLDVDGVLASRQIPRFADSRSPRTCPSTASSVRRRGPRSDERLINWGVVAWRPHRRRNRDDPRSTGNAALVCGLGRKRDADRFAPC